jgi:hypothetical protein
MGGAGPQADPLTVGLASPSGYPDSGGSLHGGTCGRSGNFRVFLPKKSRFIG